jgi:predicted Zn-dependent protease
MILLQANKNTQLLAWKPLLDVNPNNSALLLHYADLLLEQQQYQAVINLLTPATKRFNENWELWKRIAQAWNQAQDTTQEAYAMAQAYASIGALKLAQVQLDRAEKSLTNNAPLNLKNDIQLLKNTLNTQQKARENL